MQTQRAEHEGAWSEKTTLGHTLRLSTGYGPSDSKGRRGEKGYRGTRVLEYPSGNPKGVFSSRDVA